jgi:hypothetical protein
LARKIWRENLAGKFGGKIWRENLARKFGGKISAPKNWREHFGAKFFDIKNASGVDN